MIAVVVVAYSRPRETRRLIDSIVGGRFDGDTVDLILSIDKSTCQQEVCDACADVVWEHGEYKILMRPERMGLRPHILSCGELTEQYDGVIVLEDDLYVTPDFYRYAKAAMAYYGDDERVAQISLYAYGVNEFTSRPFYPAKTQHDVYAMQVTQSWGQCWSKKMWEAFKASQYYICPTITPRPQIPDNVNKWKETSWKKNFTNYIADSGKFVIYPYCSYTTNYTIAGEHCKADVSDYHVVMQEGEKNTFVFCPLEDCVKYDLFFERKDMDVAIDLCQGKKVCIDLYGKKRYYEDADMLLSTSRLPYQVMGEYALAVKPHENNLKKPEPGKGIFLYDLKIKVDTLPADNRKHVVDFDIGCLHWKGTLRHGMRGALSAIKKRIKGRK